MLVCETTDVTSTILTRAEHGVKPVVHGRPLPAGSWQHGRMNTACTHLDDLSPVEPSSDGCEDCLRIGGRWVHLRMCMECGHVGCCDNSPNRHATAHFHDHPEHPLIRSYEPGEDWWWCYVDEELFMVDGAPPAPSHP